MSECRRARILVPSAYLRGKARLPLGRTFPPRPFTRHAAAVFIPAKSGAGRCGCCLAGSVPLPPAYDSFEASATLLAIAAPTRTAAQRTALASNEAPGLHRSERPHGRHAKRTLPSCASDLQIRRALPRDRLTLRSVPATGSPPPCCVTQCGYFHDWPAASGGRGCCHFARAQADDELVLQPPGPLELHYRADAVPDAIGRPRRRDSFRTRSWFRPSSSRAKRPEGPAGSPRSLHFPTEPRAGFDCRRPRVRRSSGVMSPIRAVIPACSLSASPLFLASPG